MSTKNTKLWLIAGLACLVLTFGACDNAAKQKADGKKGGSADDEEGDAEGGGGSLDKPKGEGDFDGWCEKAGETKVEADLSKLYGALCDGGKATDLFKDELFTVVYSGSGEPKLKSIEKMTSDKAAKETKYHFGVAIKLPISIDKHFNEVGPKAGDEEAQKKLAESNGATVGAFEIKKEYENDGKYQVRGWLIYSKNSKKAGPINVTTETETRSDQFELEKDNLYMYASNTVKGVQTVKTFDMLTAGMKIGDDSYLLTVVDVVVNNKNFASEAEKQLKKTASDTIKAMYKASADVK